MWRSLFLPSYMRPAGRNTLLWDIVGKDSKHRDSLFQGDAWFNETSEATSKLTKRREVKAAIKTASQSTTLDSDDLWEAMMDAHLSGLEDDV